MFPDGNVYERMMGRWSKLAGRIFLDWLAAPKGPHWIEVGCSHIRQFVDARVISEVKGLIKRCT
jgi:hypothetical protein